MSKKTTTKPERYTIQAPQDYDCIFAFRQIPTSDAQIERIADEIVHFFDTNEDAYTLKTYLRKKRMDHKTLEDYAARNEKLRKAIAWAKMVIAERREKGGLTNKLNASMVMSTQRIYDEDYVKRDDDIAALKSKIAESSKSTYVITEVEMPKAEATQEVSEKKERDDAAKSGK